MCMLISINVRRFIGQAYKDKNSLHTGISLKKNISNIQVTCGRGGRAKKEKTHVVEIGEELEKKNKTKKMMVLKEIGEANKTETVEDAEEKE